MRLKTRLAMSIALVIGASLVLALPASTNNLPTTGTQINLVFQPPATFPANTPFYIEHGIAVFPPFSPPDGTIGSNMDAGTHFDLYLDGVAQSGKVDIDNQPGIWLKRNLYNFPSGLPVGSHTFVGVFFQDGTMFGNPVTVTVTFT
jgi:hypothetical protein